MFTAHDVEASKCESNLSLNNSCGAPSYSGCHERTNDKRHYFMHNRTYNSVHSMTGTNDTVTSELSQCQRK